MDLGESNLSYPGQYTTVQVLTLQIEPSGLQVDT